MVASEVETWPPGRRWLSAYQRTNQGAVQTAERQVCRTFTGWRSCSNFTVRCQHQDLRHNRPHNVALVIPDMEVVNGWAEEQGFQLSGDPATDGALRDKLMSEVEKYGRV